VARRGRVVEHLQHVVVLGERDDEVLWVETMDGDTVTWDGEANAAPQRW
jgi:hypothetical protein